MEDKLSQNKVLEDFTGSDYKYGFVTDIENDSVPVGLNEDIIRLISKKKKNLTGYWIFG